MHKFFNNLKAIHLDPSQLQEIHQSDLKYFPDLIYFDLVYNSIEVIEEGLFKFNPKLQFVRFYESKIVHIDPNVFDSLDKLNYFYFHTVPCINDNIASRDKVVDAIKNVKVKCTSNEYLDLEPKIKNLKEESKILNLEDFNQKLKNFENIFINSKFSRFHPLKGKFENLKMTSGCSNCAQMVKITAVDAKLDHLSTSLKCNDLKNISGRFDDVVASCNAKLDIKPLQDTLTEYLADSQVKFVELKEKLESIEQHLMSFEVRNAEKLEKEFANTRHKIEINFDQKIKENEKRLISKFEEVIDEKLGKLIEEKLKDVLDARIGIK